MLSLLLLPFLASSVAFASPVVKPLVKRSVSGPKLGVDFPDPAVFNWNGLWWAFGTQSKFDNKNIHIQVATSPDFNTWTLQQGYDALPKLPGWAVDNGETWAPDITQLSDGSFLMYFAATPSSNVSPPRKCVGTARSKTIRGPYTPDPNPFDCNIGAGGSLDASAFIDVDGTRYVTWKLDGNSLGSGGACNNGNGAAKTPILIQQVQADGVSKIGGATQLITNDPADGPDVEAPSMIRRPDGTYILFFSSNCFSSPLYDVSYATARNPRGPFTKSSKPLYVAGNYGLSGPGGMDVTIDGTKGLLHALQGDGRRFLTTSFLQYSGTNVQG